MVMEKVPNNIEDIAVVESSGNVFEDIGVICSPEEIIKMNLAIAICKTIKKRKLTQNDAAQKLGTDQSKISNISRGKLSNFSIERLILYIVKLGINIDINLKKGSKDKIGKVNIKNKVA